MVDAMARGGGDHRLGMQRHAGPGAGKHVEIVGAIADGDDVGGRPAEATGDIEERGDLGLLAEDRFGDGSGEMTVDFVKDVGAVLVEADHRRDAGSEHGEAAGDERGVAAMRLHGANQFAPAGRKRDSFRHDVVDHRHRQALQQRDPLAQRRLEGDFAIHRARGDGGNMGLDAGHVGQFVDALLVDHGGIHVGEQDGLAPARPILHDDIDRFAGKRLAQGGLDRGGAGAFRLKISGDALGERLRRHCVDGGGGAGDERRGQAGAGRVGDERGDERHGGNVSGGVKGTVLILGPTASGKSALALEIARERDAVIVNADSMQVYDVLRVLTARPDDDELAAAPHRLYGHVDPAVNYSTGMWLRDAAAEIDAADARPIIFVGGTGLYFRALLGGLADMPEIPDAIRVRWRERLADEGPAALHRLLRGADPDLAQSIKPSDGQRIVRALEVKDATGQKLSAWQAKRGKALVDTNKTEKIVLLPPRDFVHARIEARFDRMIADGAIEETRALLARGLDPALPAMKAIGVAEIGAALEGGMSFPEAIARAKARTRQYSKRQFTWLRHQLDAGWRVAS